MNQRYPQSRHTPHGGSEKPTQRKMPAYECPVLSSKAVCCLSSAHELISLVPAGRIRFCCLSSAHELIKLVPAGRKICPLFHPRAFGFTLHGATVVVPSVLVPSASGDGKCTRSRCHAPCRGLRRRQARLPCRMTSRPAWRLPAARVSFSMLSSRCSSRRWEGSVFGLWLQSQHWCTGSGRRPRLGLRLLSRGRCPS